MRSEPVPLRRATIANQAMMAKFCAQMRTMSVFGRFGWSGSTTNTAATSETSNPDARTRRWRRRCPSGLAGAPGIAGDDPGGTGGGGGGGGRWRRRREGAAHCRATLPVGRRNLRPLGGG